MLEKSFLGSCGLGASVEEVSYDVVRDVVGSGVLSDVQYGPFLVVPQVNLHARSRCAVLEQPPRAGGFRAVGGIPGKDTAQFFHDAGWLV
jgi:hypothetical protein